MAKKGVFISYILVVILIIFLYFYFGLEPKEKTEETEEILTEETFIIEKGEGMKEIAGKLKEQGLIKNKALFEIYAFLKNARTKFWPGEYRINQEMGLREIIDLLISQPEKEEEIITIIEGYSNKEIVNYLEEKELVTEEDFLKAQEKIINEKGYDFLADEHFGSLQGYLFPDTYRVYRKSSAEEIIRKMLNNFGQKLANEHRDEIKKAGKTIFETITLASLIEKEASDDLDQRIIAGIFLKRLTEGKKLESCATINYILGESKERLSYQETRIPSPYNTYVHSGLPPGPINNPGLSAIKAVIYPIKTDYLYFLSSEDGRTIFSKSFEEHQKNKEEYLK